MGTFGATIKKRKEKEMDWKLYFLIASIIALVVYVGWCMKVLWEHHLKEEKEEKEERSKK